MEFSVEVRTSPIFARGPDVVREELQTALAYGVNEIRNEIVPLVPVNLGVLRQGVQTQLSLQGEALDYQGRVFDPVGYAVPVEAGARPHFPPRGPLELWVRRKLGIADEREVRSVAFLIGRAIARRGTQARNFFRDGVARAEGRVRARLAEVPGRVLRRMAGEV